MPCARRMIMIAVAAIGTTAASAQEFSLVWSSVDGGGTMFTTAGEFELSGTIGQPDAGAMGQDGFGLNSGFWSVVAPGVTCPADITGDGQIDMSDLALLISDFGCPGPDCAADIDGDGDSDLTDLSELLAQFGLPCP